jgi:hypothetical protein
VADCHLRSLLETLDPHARDALPRVLIHDPPTATPFPPCCSAYRDGRGDDWADIIDMLTMHPEARRRVVRLLGEIGADATS